jgi:hypothetical protein
MLEKARHLARQTGTFSSVCLTVGCAVPPTEGLLDARFRVSAENLSRFGAPPEDIAALRNAMLAAPRRDEPVMRLAVAKAGAICLDVLLPGAPRRNQVTFGPAPQLFPMMHAARWLRPYVVVTIDRVCADIELLGVDGPTRGAARAACGPDDSCQAPNGGGSRHRMTFRAEHSGDRNAAEAATEVNRLVAATPPAFVLVDGDGDAASSMISGLGGAARALVIRVTSHAHADGGDVPARRAAIDRALALRARAERRRVIEQFAEAAARQVGAVQGLRDVVDSLRRGEVERVLLQDDPPSRVMLWSGSGPLDIGMERKQLVDIGVSAPVPMPADAVLVRAALASGADVVVLGGDIGNDTGSDTGSDTADGTGNDTGNNTGHDTGHDDVRLKDGVGAVLRWSDPSRQVSTTPFRRGADPRRKGRGRSAVDGMRHMRGSSGSFGVA